MNNFTGIGRTTREPEIRYTAGNEPLAIGKFTIAIDDGYGEKKRADFVPVTCFGKTAEYVEKFLRKGKLVAVEGKYTTGSYENKEGKKVYTTEIKAYRVEILEYDKTSEKSKVNVPEGFQAIDDDDDIPF